MEEMDGASVPTTMSRANRSGHKDGGKRWRRLSRMDLLAHEGIELQRLHRPRQYGVCDGQDHRASPRQDGAANRRTSSKVPEGYQMTVMPAGGLLEMMTGKSCEENTQKWTRHAMPSKKSNEQIKEQLKEVNDKSKSDEERMKAFARDAGRTEEEIEKNYSL